MEFSEDTPRLNLAALERVSGRRLFGGIRSIFDLSRQQSQAPKSALPKWERPLFYLIVLSGLIYFQVWWIVLCLWIVPAFTLLTVILRMRSIAEHFGVERENELNSSRNTTTRWWEDFLFAPHHSAAHLDHHLFPSVPFYNLPKLHRYLMEDPQYAALSHQSNSLLGTNPTSFFSEVTASEVSRVDDKQYAHPTRISG